MPEKIKITGGEKYRARVDEGKDGNIVLEYMTLFMDGSPRYHYDRRHYRLEVFLLHWHGGGGGGGGGEKPPHWHDFQLQSSSNCKEVRFSEGYEDVYEKLEQSLIDQFLS